MTSVSDYEMHSFCKDCGRHRRRMPFGDESSFFDRDPCRHCGSTRTGHQEVVRRQRAGRWPWQRDWFTRDGGLASEAAIVSTQRIW